MKTEAYRCVKSWIIKNPDEEEKSISLCFEFGKLIFLAYVAVEESIWHIKRKKKTCINWICYTEWTLDDYTLNVRGNVFFCCVVCISKYKHSCVENVKKLYFAEGLDDVNPVPQRLRRFRCACSSVAMGGEEQQACGAKAFSKSRPMLQLDKEFCQLAQKMFKIYSPRIKKSSAL